MNVTLTSDAGRQVGTFGPNVTLVIFGRANRKECSPAGTLIAPGEAAYRPSGLPSTDVVATTPPSASTQVIVSPSLNTE